MVASRICTNSQYDSGVTEPVDRMTRSIEHLDESKNLIYIYDKSRVKNKWNDGREFVLQSLSAKNSLKELQQFNQFSQSHHLLKMNAMKTIGIYDANGHPEAVPNHCIGSVISLGEDLPPGKIIQIT